MSTETTFWIIIGVMVGGLFLFKQLAQIPAGKARRLLAQGALIVDVRSAGEFRNGHVAGAINVPLETLDEAAPRMLKNKQQVLLLHCLSGARSGMAKGKLKRMGYSRVFNLGSYGRAHRLAAFGTKPVA